MRDKNKRPVTPEETTFHLLHLSLLRDYLAYEFTALKGKLKFEWNLENIIDDWILMGFLVGNDFIPHLPHLHIHHDALPLLWKTYMTVLPQLDGYLNEGGHLNMARFEKYFEELSKYDEETFESAFSDLRYLESKLGRKSINESAGQAKKGGKMRKLKPFEMDTDGVTLEELEPPAKSTTDMAIGGQFSVLAEMDNVSSDSGAEASEEESEEATNDDDEEEEDEDFDTFDAEFRLHKRDYYMSKLSYKEVTQEVLQDQARGYVMALQWILLYYFEGCPSWSWFYPHHYAPYISDVRGFKDLKIEFDLGKPFLPFEQLMAVLPAASKELLPPAMQPLMTETSSPVIDFYPVNFETDLNGKQQDWEAVVLIPFIDENRLLTAMATKAPQLTKEEKSRNCHGPHVLFEFSEENQGFYPSSLPGSFPDIHASRSKKTELHQDLFHIDPNKLRKGLLDSVRLEVYFPGFPTLNFLPHTHELKKAGVKVFQHNSRGDNMVLHVKSKEGLRLENVADELLGKSTHVGWPHLHEAKVVAVANESIKIELVEEVIKKGEKPLVSFRRKGLEGAESEIVCRDASFIKERQMDRFAIDVGNTEIVLYACPMTGRTYTYGDAGTITLDKQFSARPIAYAHQMTIKDLQVEESGHTTFQTLEEVFPEGSTVFMRGSPHYGAQGTVREVLSTEGRVRISIAVKQEPDFQQMGTFHRNTGRYFSSHSAAQFIGVESYFLSRITGSMFVEKAGSSGGPGGKVNIGLNLKFTKRREEVPGYTHFSEEYGGWQYSDKCCDAVKDYLFKFKEVFHRIQSMKKGNSDVYTEEELFPAEGSTKMADVLKYLEGLPCAKAPRMKFGSKLLDEDQIKIIEQMTSILNKNPDTVRLKVKPRLLFRPLANQGSLVPDPEADFELYDRVVVVKSGYSVPFGKRGTVVGVPAPEDEEAVSAHTLYDVVFDEEFAGGVTLRCSPNKGYRVPGSAMLNITYGEFRKDRPKQDHSSKFPSTQHRQNRGQGGRGGAPNSTNNNSNHHPGSYVDRNGPYPDRQALWKQQQQQQQQHQNVAWDNKRQPLFGKVFNESGQLYPQESGKLVQPKFITPKVQPGPQPTVNSPRNLAQSMADSQNPKANMEFEKMWTQLQALSKPKESSMPPNVAAGPTTTTAAAPVQIAQRQDRMSSASPNSTSSSTDKPQKSEVVEKAGSQFSLPPSLMNPPPPIPAGLLTATSGVASGNGAGVGPPPSKTSPRDLQGTTSPQVQSLFDSVGKSQAAAERSQVKSDEDQFMALFNSLKLQSEAAKAKSVPRLQPEHKQDVSASQADQALKQLLKIGVDLSSSADSKPTLTSPGRPSQLSPGQPARSDPLLATLPTQADVMAKPSAVPLSQGSAPSYGRQVSLQELFQEADRQQKAQQPSGPVQSGKPELDHPENRDPMTELDSYCKGNFNGNSPVLDFKHQAKQMTYIANVILPNGQRFEGSQCKTKEEAAQSAASIALLCLKAKQTPGAPLLPGFPPNTARPRMNRFFSPNSAFSPIGLPGPNPNLLPRHPPPPALLLTPQHFLNQPPPSHPLHQLFHPQPQHPGQQQQQQQNFQYRPPQQQQQLTGQNFGQESGPYQPPQSFQQSLASQSPAAFAHSPKSGGAVSTSTNTSTGGLHPTSSSSSSTQQFIPLQVSRNQKTLSAKKKESTSPGAAVTSSSDKVTGSGESIVTTPQTLFRLEEGSVTRAAEAQSSKSLPMSANSPSHGDGFQQPIKASSGQQQPLNGSDADQAGASISAVSAATSKPSPRVKSNQPKKKSRLAANFSKKP